MADNDSSGGLRGGFRLFQIAGIEIEVDYSWFIIFLLVLFSLSVGYFPSQLPGESAGAYWVAGIVAALLFFLSILLHELAHSLVAIRSGIAIPDITLFLFGGVSRLSEDAKNPKTELKVAVVGPLASFAVAGLFWLAGAWMTGAEPGGLSGAVMTYLAWINLAVGIFNLVPGFPLDGGRILRALWWWRTGSLVEATRVASNLGKGFAIVLMFLGALEIFAGALTGGLWLIFIGMFLRGVAQAGLQDLVMRRSLEGIRVGDLELEEAVSVPTGLSVKELVDDYFLRLGHRRFPVSNDGHEPVGVVTLENVKSVPKDERERTRVEEIMSSLGDEDVVHPKTALLEALRKFRHGDGGILVMGANHEVQGILTQNEVRRLLEVRQALS